MQFLGYPLLYYLDALSYCPLYCLILTQPVLLTVAAQTFDSYQCVHIFIHLLVVFIFILSNQTLNKNAMEASLKTTGLRLAAVVNDGVVPHSTWEISLTKMCVHFWNIFSSGKSTSMHNTDLLAYIFIMTGPRVVVFGCERLWIVSSGERRPHTDLSIKACSKEYPKSPLLI